jgi:hypothetical protein
MVLGLNAMDRSDVCTIGAVFVSWKLLGAPLDWGILTKNSRHPQTASPAPTAVEYSYTNPTTDGDISPMVQVECWEEMKKGGELFN